jgi:hypothetical protein
MGFPEAIDRYRLIQRIVRTARATYVDRIGSMESDLQVHVAKRAGVAMATVANMENLENSANDPSRRPGRDRFIQVLSWGLKLDRDEIDALLWLFDESILSRDEVQRYLGYLPDKQRFARPNHTKTAKRQTVLRLLEEALLVAFTKARQQPGSQETKMILYGADAQGRLASAQALLELEQREGQRLRIAQLPSLVNVPPAMYADPAVLDRWLGQERWPAAQRAEGRRIFVERTRVVEANLDRFGGRTILERESLQRYLGDHPSSQRRLPIERRRHVEHLLRQLRDHPLFAIGIVDDASDLEINLKSISMFMLRSAQHRELRRSDTSWGPHYIACRDETAVLQFYLDFEKAWDLIPTHDRDRESVIAQLQAMLESTA